MGLDTLKQNFQKVPEQHILGLLQLLAMYFSNEPCYEVRY